MNGKIAFIVFAATLWISILYGQQLPGQLLTPSVAAAPQTPPKESRRIFGIIPNNRTSPSLTNYQPISAKEKFEIARQDSFDRGTVILAAIFAGDSQLSDAHPAFGQGVAGYSRYFGTAYADLIIGNYLSEAVFPVLLHQDPRYFRRGVGSRRSRLGYSMGQIFWTHTDSNHSQLNYSELFGNAAAVAISTSYYSDGRNPGDATTKFSLQLGVDMASNVLKEFWPDVSRRFSKTHSHQ